MKVRIGIILVLVIGLVTAYWLLHRSPGIAVATMDQVSEIVAKLKQSEGYVDGGPFLADFERPGGTVFDPKTLEGASYRNYAVRTVILTDWLDTLKPAQIETMRKIGRLSYASLPSDQQKMLQLLYKYDRPFDIKESDLPQSAIVILKDRGGAYLNWLVIKDKKIIVNHGYYLSNMDKQMKYADDVANKQSRRRRTN